MSCLICSLRVSCPPLSWLSQSPLTRLYMYNYTTVDYLSDLSDDFIIVIVRSSVIGSHFQHSDASNSVLIVIDGLSLEAAQRMRCARGKMSDLGGMQHRRSR